MGSVRIEFVSRSQTPNIREIDKDVKNVWRWDWMKRKVDGIRLKESLKKLTKPGKAYCILCSKEIQYGSRGYVALNDHVSSTKHKANQMRKNPQSGKSTNNEAVKLQGDKILSSQEGKPEAETTIKIEDDIEDETEATHSKEEIELEESRIKRETLTSTPSSTTTSNEQMSPLVDNSLLTTEDPINISQRAKAKPSVKDPPGPNEIDSFFTYVSAKVKKYSPEAQNRVQHAVFDILVQADRGMFDMPTPAMYPQPYYSQEHASVSYFAGPSDSQVSFSTNSAPHSPDSTSSENSV